MADLASAVAVLRWLIGQDYRQTPAFIVRTRFERALLALAAEVALRWYGTPVTELRRPAVEEFIRRQPAANTKAEELLWEIVDLFEEFLGFSDVDEYSIHGRHRNIERSAERVHSLCDRLERSERA